MPREIAKGYFAWDRKLWKDDIIELLNYLKKLEVIKSYNFPESELYADVVLNVDKYRKIYKSAEKRNNLKYNRIIKFEPLDKPNGKLLANYEPESGLLTIGNKSVQLQKNAFNAKMLELLLKNAKNKKKKWSWDEIIETIDEVNTLESIKEYKRKFYNACDGVTKTIAANTGINDLLIFTKTDVYINSKFF